MDPLSGIDATFLYLEQPHTPMHVGSVLVFEGSMRFDEFRETLASRIHLVPRMTQRLLTVPLDLGKPYWVEDPDFDLDLHLQYVALPRPGNWRQLRRLASRTFSVPVDRSRPLWEMVFVEGLDQISQVPPGSVALISKVHHAAIDGVSGADMMSILFDVSAKPRPIEPPAPRSVAAVPNELQVLLETGRRIARAPRQVPGLLRDGVRALRAGSATRVKGLEAPPQPFSAPNSPLNQEVSVKRVWNTALLSLDRVKGLKRALECTLNDVVLAICAGALREYLQLHDALPDQPLVSMVPVSTRGDDAHGAMGNQISAILVQLATDVDDPIERVKAARRHALAGKAYQDAIGAGTLADVAEFVPFALANNAARLYSRFGMVKRHRPICNLVITNVPGPQVDLYVARHRLLCSMGMAPIIDGMGLIITVLSYNGVLSISPTSSAAIMPDIDVFARLLREQANALETAVLERHPPATEPAGADGRPADIPGMFEQLRVQLAARPVEDPLPVGTFQFCVTGPAHGLWTVVPRERTVSAGQTASPDATLTVLDEDLAQIVHGTLDPQSAFVQGKLRVEGEIREAIAFCTLLAGDALASVSPPGPPPG